ncbi:sensor histidine kinase [Kitasatospora brasiliensis]|uniref:sensor histidine kinase n=1 Tax=Kitasatospora brasiliensis TaxID=3058040 RepID=UPI002930D83F|nr:HAMP domain-containing sensor histidine kinase [Kitasatospora sp. K002]
MLRTRIGLVVLASVLLAIAVPVISAYRGVSTLVSDQLDRSLQDRTQTVLTALDLGRLPPVRPDTVEQLLPADGPAQKLTPGAPALPVSARALEVARTGQGSHQEDATVDGTPYGVLTQARPDGQGAVMVGQTYAGVTEVDEAFLQRITVTSAAAALSCALLSWLVLGRILRPVRRLADAAEHITTTRDLATPLPAAGRDEIGGLTRAFESMVGALRHSREQQQRLVQDASHELRTPLTSVRGCAELLQRARGRLAPEDEEQILATLVTETVALDEIVRELVELATDQQTAEDPEPLDLPDAAEDSARRFHRRTGREIAVTVEGPVPVLARPRALQRCVDNLVGNAVKFSPDGTPVEIRITGTRLSVRDHGPGIAPDDRQAVFERFFRAAGTQATPGSGLGLAIVHDLVAADHGSVFATAAPDGGAEVGFHLPPAPQIMHSSHIVPSKV